MKLSHFAFISCFLATTSVKAQSDFYNSDTLVEVRMYFQEPNWDYILDSLFVEGNEGRLMGNLVIDGASYFNVGVRYKGFSSASVNRTKNPFNIKLDYAINNQNHLGHDKIKLSNVIQDPSFVREVLSYEIARKYMPASGASFANVYVNDTLIGLYTNVEAVNKDFLIDHFGTKNNAFFKGNPQSLDLNGENSNLGNSAGTDSSDYYSLYDLKSNNGWSRLYELIDVLNSNPTNIETVLNVDRTLWMHAFNYSLINFDSYVGYAQNYYLYEDHNGQFNPILWDMNMSFASFRLADASEFWDGFSIAEAKTIDPLLHYNSVSVYARPLMRNLFENSTYRKMYLAHMRTIMEENFDNQDYYNRGQELQALIDTSVMNDTNKFYSYADFQDNITSTVSDLVDYAGITDLMDARSTYLNAYAGFSGAPTISNITSSTNPSVGGDLTISASIANANEIILAYRYSSWDLFQTLPMLDDGNNGDGFAGDGIFGATLSNIGNAIEYYLYAQNDSAGRFSPERAAYEYHTLNFNASYKDLVVNEFMASNSTTVADQNGEYNDWIELYNNSTSIISTSGLYLSDKIDTLFKWEMPAVSIAPNSYLIVWADKDTLQNGMHSNFKLSSFGDQIVLVYADSTIIDSVTFGSQVTDVSLSRSPNGTGNFTVIPTTFNANNTNLSVENSLSQTPFNVYPNPATKEFFIQSNFNEAVSVQINSVDGKLVSTFYNYPPNSWIKVDADIYSIGLYFVTLSSPNQTLTKKVIIQ